jgi:hypothetical protein
MKKILLTINLLSSVVAHAECSLRAATQLSNEYTVSAPYDVVKNKASGRCNVQFKLKIDGQEYQVNETVNGMLPDEMLCHQAIAQGRSNILVNLGGKYKTEMINVCKEGINPDFKPIKIGQVILENEVAKVPGIEQYFTHSKSKCRMFREKYPAEGRMVVNHGVICQTGGHAEDWLIVDKW